MPSPRTFRILSAACGIAGQLALGAYYSGALVPRALLTGADTTSLMALAASHRLGVMVDAWLQCVGALLSVIFFLALVHLAGGGRRFAGWMTAVAASLLLAVAIADATFVIAAANAASLGHEPTVSVAFDLVAGPGEAFDYAFLFAPAPALIISLGALLLGADVLPRPFAWTALAIGVAFLGVGMMALAHPLTGPTGAAFLSVQLVQVAWILTAAVTLLVREPRTGAQDQGSDKKSV